MARTLNQSLQLLNPMLREQTSVQGDENWINQKARTIDELQRAKIASSNLISSLQDQDPTFYTETVAALRGFLEDIDSRLHNREDVGIGSNIKYACRLTINSVGRLGWPDCFSRCMQGREEFEKQRRIAHDLKDLCDVVGSFGGILSDSSGEGHEGPAALAFDYDPMFFEDADAILLNSLASSQHSDTEDSYTEVKRTLKRRVARVQHSTPLATAENAPAKNLKSRSPSPSATENCDSSVKREVRQSNFSGLCMSGSSDDLLNPFPEKRNATMHGRRSPNHESLKKQGYEELKFSSDDLVGLSISRH